MNLFEIHFVDFLMIYSTIFPEMEAVLMLPVEKKGKPEEKLDFQE